MTSGAAASPLGALPLAFTKMSGAGNDFIVFGARVEGGEKEIAAIRRLCRRGTGVGADGVLFVTAESPGDPASRVVADYRNADGSTARFCGNGTRCAARFAVLRGLARPTCVVLTGWGAVGARVSPLGSVTLALPEPVAAGSAVPSLDPGGHTLERGAFALPVGVPHVVAFLKEDIALDTLDLSVLGPAHRHHPAMTEGANANFVKVLGPSRLALRTWERGVERDARLRFGSRRRRGRVELAERPCAAGLGRDALRRNARGRICPRRRKGARGDASGGRARRLRGHAEPVGMGGTMRVVRVPQDGRGPALARWVRDAGEAISARLPRLPGASRGVSHVYSQSQRGGSPPFF